MRPLILGVAGKPVIICETDLDAWLISQQASEIITSVSVGSSGGKPDTLLSIYLFLAPKILISLDSDQAGKNASKWWIDKFPKAKYWPVPWKKDPGEAFGSAPVLLKRWIQTGLETMKSEKGGNSCEYKTESTNTGCCSININRNQIG